MYADTDRGTITDDAMLVERYTDVPVKMAMGAYTNIKITTPEDMGIAAAVSLKNKKQNRTGCFKKVISTRCMIYRIMECCKNSRNGGVTQWNRQSV